MTLTQDQCAALAKACRRIKVNKSSAVLDEFAGWSIQISTEKVAVFVYAGGPWDELRAKVHHLAKPGSIEEPALLGCKGIFFLPK